MAKKTMQKLSTDELQAELERREREAVKLAAKRDKLLAQVAEIDEELASYGYEAVNGRAAGSRSRSRAGGGRKRPKNDMSLVDALKKAMAGKTMGVTEAAEAAKKVGYRSSSANFRNIVNQTLLKNPDVFKKVDRGQYAVK